MSPPPCGDLRTGTPAAQAAGSAPGARRARQFAVLVCVLSSLFREAASPAADKNGVSPNTISLPKGPGSMEGLGESFQPTLNTGTAKYAVALKLPPGTAGHAPALALSYEGGGGNGPVGFGWQIAVPHVQRRCDEGMPLYPGEAPPTALDDWSARYQTFLSETKEELVPAATGFYQGKNEGAFVRYQNAGTHWIGTAPDGKRLEFGISESGRVQDGTNRVFRWLLERETDTRGNTIVYSYTHFPGLQNTNQRYLAAVAYGPGAPPWANFHFVTFLYEDRSDWFEDCRSGFPVRTGKRLRSIVIGTQGPALPGHLQGDSNQDGTPDCLDRRYDLEYLNHAGPPTQGSLLSTLTLVGADGATTLPPMTLGYAVCEPPDLASATNALIGGTNEPTAVPDNPNVEFIDLNGDGLPDLLRTYPGGTPPRAYLNRGGIGTGTARQIAWASGVDMGGDAQAAGYALSSNSVHLADMDGDGLSDLVAHALNGTVFYFANRASVQWGNRRTMTTNDYAPPSPFGSADVRTADLDFDKRMDIVESVSPGGSVSYRVWFNLGHNRYSQRKTVTPATGFLFSASGVHLADFNGDRLSDIMQVRSSSVLATVGLGYGRFADAVSVPLDQTLDSFQIAASKMEDINGDGWADLVIERAEPGRLWYWINRGNYSFSPRKIITGMPTAFTAATVVRWADLNGDGATDLIYADSTAIPRLRTVNLAGLLNGGGYPNLLTAISNGTGRITLIGYAPSTQFALEDAAAGRPWPDPMPFPVEVVAAVTTLDSLGHSYLTQFRYHDGYYDPAEKQFRGFARVEQVDVGDPSAPTLVTRSHFDTGRHFGALKGRLLRLTAEQEDGGVFTDTCTAWTSPPRTLYVGTNGVEVHYAHPVGRTNRIKELGQGTERRLESEFAYDGYGNQSTNADYGLVEHSDRSAFNDERITSTEYAVNLTAWLIRHPMRQEIQDENGVVISRTEFYYDDETFSGNNLGRVTIGHVTMRREWIDPANPARFIISSRSQYDAHGNPVVLLDPLAVAPGGAVDFNQGHARGLEYDPRFHAYPVTETIHVGHGKTPLVFQATYDEGFGTISTSADFNSNPTVYGYDGLARLTRIVKPGDTLAYPTVEYDYALAVGFPLSLGGGGQEEGVVNYVETRQRDQSEIRNPKSEMYFISRQYVDGLGRQLMSKTEAEPETGGGPPRVTVKGAVQFNTRRKPAHLLNPFFSLQGASLDERLAFENIEASGWRGQFHDEGRLVALDLASAHATVTDYDATLREQRVAHPDGTQRRTLYEPLVIWSFDENDADPSSPYHDTPIVHHNDGLGRLVQVDETTRLNDDGTPAGDLRTWITRYEYDLNDQLTRITDSQNNVKVFAYDGVRRKTEMNDPDRGVMRWLYDDASNLAETTDAKGQRITYTYDGANRVLAEKYHDGLPPPPWRALFPIGGESQTEGASNSVVYHYDTPCTSLPQGDHTIATARNVKGMLAWVEDLSGEEHISYDSRGRSEWIVKRIPDPLFHSLSVPGAESVGEETLISYRTGFDYDSADRVTRVVYPDNDELGYRYNERSLVHQIVGGAHGLTQNGLVIPGIRYQPSDQRAEINYGNGVRTTYAYDSRLRLKELDTRHSTLDTRLVHFFYGFDRVSNIESIEDRRPGSAVPEGDPRRNTQLFQYDDLDRLTRAQYSFNLPGQPIRHDGEISYRYDRLGNMLAQSSTLDHQEKGLPVANLGEMDSGGTLGRWNRTGRAATDPPGPHALSTIRNAECGMRHYPYDANGNMTVIDGLVCTWDFKDRLVSVENHEMRAHYTYDYTDRRVLKTVWPKAATNSPSTVVYINKHFEVREHDAPTKYVWNGEMRVARVTGSLNANVRIQRLRVWRGWNLCSLAVTATNAVEQLTGSPTGLRARSEGSEVRADGIFKWNPATLGWDAVPRGETLPAGTVLWLQATTNGVLTVTGIYSDPTNRTVTPAGDFLPSAGLAAWDVRSALSNLPSASAWAYDTPSTRWFSWLPPPLEQHSALPAFLAPGEAIFVRSEAPTVLEPSPHASALQFYHGDHLETVVGITDQAARLLEETAYYPFGSVRHGHSWQGTPAPYAFLQKERDLETSLHHLEARYYHAVLGRFVSLDPLANTPAQSALRSSAIQPYGYGRANPLRYHDANGLSPNRPPTERELLMAFGISEREAGKAVNWYAQEVNDPETQRYLKSKGGKETFQEESQSITLESTGERKLKESRTTEEGVQASESTVEGQRLGRDNYRVESTEYEFYDVPKGERGAAKAALDKKPPPATKPTRPRAKIGPKFKVTIGPVTIVGPPAARPENIAGQTHPDFPGATTDPNYLIEHPHQVGNACEQW